MRRISISMQIVAQLTLQIVIQQQQQQQQRQTPGAAAFVQAPNGNLVLQHRRSKQPLPGPPPSHFTAGWFSFPVSDGTERARGRGGGSCRVRRTAASKNVDGRDGEMTAGSSQPTLERLTVNAAEILTAKDVILSKEKDLRLNFSSWVLGCGGLALGDWLFLSAYAAGLVACRELKAPEWAAAILGLAFSGLLGPLLPSELLPMGGGVGVMSPASFLVATGLLAVGVSLLEAETATVAGSEEEDIQESMAGALGGSQGWERRALQSWDEELARRSSGRE